MKKVLCLFILCMILVIDCGTSFAKTKENVIEKANSENDFLNTFYSGKKEIYVTDEKGNNVTEKFLKKTREMYNNREVEEINEIIASENLVLHVVNEEIEENSLMQLAYEQYKSVRSEMFYFELEAQNGSRITVTSELIGGIWYNPNTSRVTRVSNPTYTILSTDPSIGVVTSNFKTGSSVSGGKGHFWGECSFEFHTQIVEQGVPYNVDISYGSKRVAFYATP